SGRLIPAARRCSSSSRMEGSEPKKFFMVASPANHSSRQPSRLGKGTKPCQREIHGVRSFLVGLTYQINGELMATVAVFTPEAPQSYRHELLPVKPDNPVRFDRRKPWRNLKPRHRTCWSYRDIR